MQGNVHWPAGVLSSPPLPIENQPVGNATKENKPAKANQGNVNNVFAVMSKDNFKEITNQSAWKSDRKACFFVVNILVLSLK